jgi:hypothetical protein
MKNKTEVTKELIKLNEVNLNGRIYLDNDNLRQSIEDFNKRVENTGVMYGEFEHPSRFDVSLNRVSHTVKNVRIEENSVLGDVTILNTKYGKKIKEFEDMFVFRPRSAGNINLDGTVNIKKIFTFDAIPKDTDAFNMENATAKNEGKRIYDDLYIYEENFEKFKKAAELVERIIETVEINHLEEEIVNSCNDISLYNRREFYRHLNSLFLNVLLNRLDSVPKGTEQKVVESRRIIVNILNG